CMNAASQLLQAKDANILKATTLLQNAISVLMEFREQFAEAQSATLALARKWGSQTQFEATRARKLSVTLMNFLKTATSLTQRATFGCLFLMPVLILSSSNCPKDSPA
ncbi:hypothetical protein GOODEAATRI_024310, partial [Goodea atripinnis]